MKEYPNNIDYLIKLAGNYSQLENYEKARIYYRKAYDLDDSNPNAISGVMGSYISENRILEAINFLNKDIEKDNKLDFEDFFALSKLLECYIIKNDMPNLKNTLEKIKKIAPEDEESKGFISWKLGKLAAELYEMGIYEYSKEILEICLKLTPDINLIQELYKQVNLCVEVNKLMDDGNIYGSSKIPIYNYFFGEKLDEETKKQMFQKLEGELKTSIGKEYFKGGVQKIKERYPMLYNEPAINEIYTKLLRVSSQGSNILTRFIIIGAILLVIRVIFG